MSDMGIDWIKKILPHRQPFLLIDRVIELNASKSIVAIKNVTYNEPFFQGHFPQYPVMPGVLIVEAMAQAAAILSYTSPRLPELMTEEGRKNKIALFAGMDEVRFRKPVVPGDTLRFEVEMTHFRQTCCKVDAKATVDGDLVCSAKLMSFIRDISDDS